MKMQNIALLGAVAALSACGSAVQMTSSERQYEDGFYAGVTAKDRLRPAREAVEETDDLIDRTKGSEIYLKGNRVDTLFIPENMSASIKLNKAEQTTTVTLYDGAPDIDLFLGYSPYSVWRSGYWGPYRPWRHGFSSWSYYGGLYDPWYFGGLYDPWYYGGLYDPWYYGGLYDPWYYGTFYDPWLHGSWHSPYYYGWGGYHSPWGYPWGGYYGAYYGGYGSWYGPYYGGWYDRGGIYGIPGERYDAGYGRTWGSRTGVSSNPRGDATGAVRGGVRRNSSARANNSLASSSTAKTRASSLIQTYRRVGGSVSRDGGSSVSRGTAGTAAYGRNAGSHSRGGSAYSSAGSAPAYSRRLNGTSGSVSSYNYRRPTVSRNSTYSGSGSSYYGNSGGSAAYRRSSAGTGSFRRGSTTSGTTYRNSYSGASRSYSSGTTSSYRSGSYSSGSTSSYSGGTGSYSRSGGNSSSYSRSGGSTGGSRRR